MPFRSALSGVAQWSDYLWELTLWPRSPIGAKSVMADTVRPVDLLLSLVDPPYCLHPPLKREGPVCEPISDNDDTAVVAAANSASSASSGSKPLHTSSDLHV